MDYVKKVILSCKTFDQLSTCYFWIENNNYIYGKDSIEKYFYLSECATLIEDMKIYLNKLNKEKN